MCDEGVLVAGAPPGRKGAGCFKVSQEEKSRIADAAKAAAKKLKAQQKQGLGKVGLGEVILLQREICVSSGCIQSPEEGCQNECWEEGCQGCICREEGRC